MLEHLFSFYGLAIALPFIICAIIITAAFYGHLNFKHIPINTISLVCAALMLPVAAFYIQTIIDFAFDRNISVFHAHGFFAGLMIGCVLILRILVPRSIPNFSQILGLIIFLGSFYYTLA